MKIFSGLTGGLGKSGDHNNKTCSKRTQTFVANAVPTELHHLPSKSIELELYPTATGPIGEKQAPAGIRAMGVIYPKNNLEAMLVKRTKISPKAVIEGQIPFGHCSYIVFVCIRRGC